ncbi:MAG: PepSY domain-containing protein [Pseudomonadota bacterium]
MSVNLNRLLRQIHYWLSLAIFLPAGIILFAGIFLMLKKDVDWIQPPTTRGVVADQIPAISYEQMVAASRLHPEAGVMEWSDIDRIDLRTGRGIAKIQAKSGWEIQIDTNTGNVLNVAYRRSDIIESIHDGSFFSDRVKNYIFLPTGIVLIIMWGTGIYLFFLPQVKRRSKRRQKARHKVQQVR